MFLRLKYAVNGEKNLFLMVRLWWKNLPIPSLSKSQMVPFVSWKRWKIGKKFWIRIEFHTKNKKNFYEIRSVHKKDWHWNLYFNSSKENWKFLKNKNSHLLMTPKSIAILIERENFKFLKTSAVFFSSLRIQLLDYDHCFYTIDPGI